MVKVKDLEEVKKRYEQAANYAPERYSRAIPTIEWQKNAIAAEDLWAAKIQEAASRKLRAKGIARISDEEFRRALAEKGAPVLGTRMRMAVNRHAENWAPYRDALQSVSLPPKTADPIANIDNRVKPIVEALVRKKRELKG